MGLYPLDNMDKRRNQGIRNIAIIAHVDHGKTTLVDALLRQGHVFRPNQQVGELIMDTNPLERERGITILAKNTAIHYKDVKINIIDTPGHADFSGEVERIMHMADGCLLLVDAVDGPMPQTRYLLKQALKQKIAPLVVINKIDRAEARAPEVVSLVQDLFLELATEPEQLDFPVLYASARQEYAVTDLDGPREDMEPLLRAMLEHVPAPSGDPDLPLQMLVAALDYDQYLGQVGIGRIFRGKLQHREPVALISREEGTSPHTVEKVFVFHGLERLEVLVAEAGDIVAVTGIDGVAIGDTITSPEEPEALPLIEIEEPTVKMTFGVNTSPFMGREGPLCTSRNLQERLTRELRTNVSLRVEPTSTTDEFLVSGRGELHLAILVETMRREGYEFQVSKPEPVTRVIDGKVHEPFELLTLDTREEFIGPLTENLSGRLAQLVQGADRIPVLLSAHHSGEWGGQQSIRRLPANEGGGKGGPGRRFGGHRKGGGGNLRAAERPGQGQYLRGTGYSSVRGDDRGHASSRGRHWHQCLQGKKADQHAFLHRRHRQAA